MKSVLFVCLGNICRSPALQAVFEKQLKKKKQDHHFYVESCGMNASFLGAQADERMVAVAKKHGVEIDHTAQAFDETFFDRFDFIYTVDRETLDMVFAFCPTKNTSKCQIVSHVSKKYLNQDIPDPYYLPDDGFKTVYEMIEEIADSLVKFHCA